MIKRLLAIKCLLFSLISLPALACEHPQGYIPIAERPSKSLLYEISGCGIQASYIFGTYHSDSPRLKPIINHIAPYLYKTKTLWVEIESSPQDAFIAMKHITIPPDQPDLKSLVGESLYKEAVTKIGPVLKFNEQTINRFKPWALALMVQYPPSESDGMILDARLQGFATLKDIDVQGLESMQSQYSIFENMPQPMQVDFLKNTLEDFDQLQAMIDALSEAYYAQDLPQLHQQSMDLLRQSAENYPDLAQYLEKRLIDERNLGMAKTLTENAKSPMFVAVGALHLPGKTGLLQLLESTGLQIRPIPMR